MTKTNDVSPASDVAKPYEPTLQEQAIIDAFNAYRRNHDAPAFKSVEVDGGRGFQVDHPDIDTGHLLLGAAIGVRDNGFYKGLLTMLANVNRGRETDVDSMNFMVSVVRGIDPRDQVEAMLAAQMAITHCQIMTYGRRLAAADTMMMCESAERILTRLSRTFAVQMDTLKRYRSTGEQRVTVQHVTVNDGGQAIVGTVEGRPAGGGDAKK